MNASIGARALKNLVVFCVGGIAPKAAIDPLHVAAPPAVSPALLAAVAREAPASAAPVGTDSKTPVSEMRDPTPYVRQMEFLRQRIGPGESETKSVADESDLRLELMGRRLAVMTARNFRTLMGPSGPALAAGTRFVLAEGRSGRFWELSESGEIRLQAERENPVIAGGGEPRSFLDAAEPRRPASYGDFGRGLSRKLTLAWSGGEFRISNGDASFPVRAASLDSPVRNFPGDWPGRIEDKLAFLNALFDIHLQEQALAPVAHLSRIPAKDGRDPRVRFEDVPGEIAADAIAHHDASRNEIVFSLRYSGAPSHLLLPSRIHEAQHRYDVIHREGASRFRVDEYRAYRAAAAAAPYVLDLHRLLADEPGYHMADNPAAGRIMAHLDSLSALTTTREIKRLVDQNYPHLKDIPTFVALLRRQLERDSALGAAMRLQRHQQRYRIAELESFDTMEMAIQPATDLAQGDHRVLQALIEASAKESSRLARAERDAEEFIAGGLPAEARDAREKAASALAAFYRDKLSPDAAPVTSVVHARPSALRDGTDSADLQSYYRPERAALQMAAIRRLFDRADRSLPPPGRRPVAVLQGGVPASGKSHAGRAALIGANSPFDAATADELPRRAVLIDPDAFKKSLPEYDGANASLVHPETADMVLYALRKTVAEGRNVIFENSMGNLEYVRRQIQLLKDAGYDVEIVGTLLPNDKAIGRAATRVIERGRFIPFDLIALSESNQNLLRLASMNDALGLRRVRLYGTDVPKGAVPILLYDSDGAR